MFEIVIFGSLVETVKWVRFFRIHIVVTLCIRIKVRELVFLNVKNCGFVNVRSYIWRFVQ